MENLTLSNLFKRKSIVLLTVIFVPGILFLGMMLAIAEKNGIYFSSFSRDPIQLLNGKPYLGIISSIGIIFWCSTTAILFFSSRICRLQNRPKEQTFFLFFGGLLSVMMLIDDFFMMHDVIFPEYLNINEIFFYLFYGLSVIAIFFYYYKLVLKTDYILLILSFFLLGSSALTDQIIAFGFKIDRPYIIEDGFKFLGIIAWFAYFGRTSFKFIRPAKELKEL